MSKNSNDPFGIGHWERWKQLTVFVLVLLLGMGALEYIKSALSGSAEAKTYKAQMKPLALQLEKAQQLGDKPTTLALAGATTNIVNDYNRLDDDKKAAINNSALRYCVLAAVHLSSGPIEVLQTGSWVTKSKYEAAFEECR